ncbi:MAG: CHASE domain-containing protein [Burkholderiales bacterium]|nr:CHASE domain-containing protein [Burkholderiales bacterium]
MNGSWDWFRDRWIGKTAAVMVLIIGLLVTALMWRAETSKSRLEADAKVIEQANALASRVRQRLAAYEQVLRGGGALFAATTYPSREQWRSYVEALDIERTYGGLLAVSFAAWLRAEQVPAFESMARADGLPQFHVWPPGDRAKVSAVLYAEPADPINQRSLGYDMYADPVRQSAMQTARDSGLPTLTPPLPMMQEAGGNAPLAVTMFLPLYRYSASVGTVDERRKALAGWVFAPFRPADLVASLGRAHAPAMSIRLLAEHGAAPAAVLYADAPAPPVGSSPQAALRVPIDVLGSVWILEAWPRTQAGWSSGLHRPWETLFGGILVSLLLFAVVWSMATTQERAYELAASMTVALRRTNEALDVRVRERTAELTRANARLREQIVERERIEAERAAAFERERERSAQLRALADASLGISLAPKHGVRLEYLAERACHIVRCSHAVVLADVRGDEPPWVAATSTLPMASEQRERLLEAARTWPAAQQIELVEGPLPLPLRDEADAPINGQVLSMPVALGADPPIGTLYLLHSGANRFSDEDLVIVRQLVLMVTASIATAAAVENERRARFEAESANRTKDEFLAIVSHELRTPLHAIIGWLHVIERKGISGEHLVRALEVIRRNADAQSGLVDDLLDLARLERGKLQMNMERLSFDALVASAIDAHRQVAAGKNVELNVDYAARGDVEGDPLRLLQAVNNLIGNALKFTPAGGHVWVTLRRQGEQLVLEVRDDGDGIEPAMLPHVFDRFRQADSSSRRRRGGLGLGLALVKHIVEMHGGDSSADSAGKGLGATFRIGLPELARAAALDLAGGAAAASAGERLPRGRVMVIDDQDDAREALVHWLVGEGFDPRAFSSVDEAIGWLERGPPAQWPQVVLCDIEMPGRDGYEFVDALRELERLRGTADALLPVVAVTAYVSAEERARAIAHGFVSHLAKPVTPQTLVRALERLLA